VLPKSKPRTKTLVPSTKPLRSLAFSKLVFDDVCTWIRVIPFAVNSPGRLPILKLEPDGATDTAAVRRVARKRRRSVVSVIAREPDHL